jgi:hypothetical protein
MRILTKKETRGNEKKEERKQERKRRKEAVRNEKQMAVARHKKKRNRNKGKFAQKLLISSIKRIKKFIIFISLEESDYNMESSSQHILFQAFALFFFQ